MDERKCPVRMVEKASELADEVKADLPADYQPEGDPWPLEVANVRHWHTDYEGLLQSLPECSCCSPDWPGCDENCPLIDYDGDVPMCGCHERGPAQRAHDILKWAANDLAETALREWCSKQQE